MTQKIITVNGRQISCKQVDLGDNLFIQVPENFETKSVAGRYTCLSDRSDHLLGIAVRFARLRANETQEKIVRSYFGGEETQQIGAEKQILFRESTYSGQSLSVYLLRFAIQVPDGLLLGCFNCDASDKACWRDAALQILQSIYNV